MSTMPPASPSSISEAWQRILTSLDLARRPEDILEMLSALPIIGAAVLTVVGIACIFQGFRRHKIIVVVLSLLLGFAIGRLISEDLGRSVVVALALGVLLAAIAQPLLKYTVALFAGIAGAGIGATLWSFLNPEQSDLAWAGGGMGFVFLALLSFMFFRIVVILFTSVGGGAMFVLGSVGLLLHIEPIQAKVWNQIVVHPAVLPLLVATAAVIGFVYQQRGETPGHESYADADED